MTAAPKSSTGKDELQQIAARRLFPRLTDPSFLVLRSRREIFKRWMAELGQSLVVLDVGGRYQPYRPLLDGRVSHYVAVDILQTELVDVVGSGDALPFPENTFDVVILTQVLEYFPQPQAAVQQIYSVLKPGGKLLMSVPAFAPRFGDDQRWTFTPKGITETLALFRAVEIVPELSSVGGLIRTANLAVNTMARYEPVRKAVQVTICPLLNLLGMGLEELRLTKGDQFTPNYSVRAVK